MLLGFSTDCLAHANVQRGLRIATHRRAKAVELSALREDELDPLLDSLDRLEDDLKPFEYVSFHAPSIILETPVATDEVEEEIASAEKVFTNGVNGKN